jgi:hypothetical protein
MLEILQAKFRRFTQLKGQGPIDVRATGCESLAVAQVEGSRDEASRAGIRFKGSTTISTGQASVLGSALPTTGAQFLIYNPSQNLVTAFMDEIGMVMVSGTTGGTGAVILACNVPAGNIPATLPTMLASATIRNANPGSSKGSNLVLASGQTLATTAGTNNWWPLCNQLRTDTLTGQWQIGISGLDGIICIAPGTGLAISLVSTAGSGSPLYALYETHREYAADME